jgi:hypothetical protein
MCDVSVAQIEERLHQCHWLGIASCPHGSWPELHVNHIGFVNPAQVIQPALQDEALVSMRADAQRSNVCSVPQDV